MRKRGAGCLRETGPMGIAGGVIPLSDSLSLSLSLFLKFGFFGQRQREIARGLCKRRSPKSQS